MIAAHDSFYARHGKRWLDATAAAAGLALLAPVLAVTAMLVKLHDRGPVLFVQARAGQGFTTFRMLKFRTMGAGGRRRVTGPGRLLRAGKLDELPQLFNVLRGQMSLVGPRPELATYVDLFRNDYLVLLAARPGLTDHASLAFRDEEALLRRYPDPGAAYIRDILPAKIALSRRYLSEMGFLTDAQLVLATLRACARGAGSNFLSRQKRGKYPTG